MDFFVRLQESGFSQWVRETDSLFGFAGILLLHTIGMGFVVGIAAVFGLRVLGFAPSVRLKAIAKFFPVMWTGFAINAITGTILLIVNFTKLTHNVDFYVKLAFIALAVVNMVVLKKHALGPDETVPPTTTAKILAVTALIFWIGAITAGRLLAYVGKGSITF